MRTTQRPAHPRHTLADALRQHGFDDLAATLADDERTRIPVATAMQLSSAPDPSTLR